ncbi:MAG TPA: glycosyltransferase, partial [Chloroflexota bacterium]|nr:glycosyltransferase [Chloroflexota bacterium]
TAVSGADEVVEEGKTGFLVPLKDPSALADRILRVLADPQRAAERGQRGRALARERYDRQHNLAEMVRMWQATAAARKR